ncbi:MAG: hypothetical protein JF588_16385 [Caulobacterales bacterium]|nr:hypothetical protein [Caulobacterales bacterium]
MLRPRLLVTASLLTAALSAQAAQAHLVRIEVEKVAPAKPLPGAPAYEIVSGRFFGELDPADRRNRIITDLAGAPRNARGRVEYSATFAIARPVDPAKASGVLFYDVPNRGNFIIGADPYGHVRVVSGWQGDLPEDAGLQTVHAPVAHGPGGRPLTGPVLARFVDMPAGATSLPIVGSIGRPTPRPEPVSLDTHQARLVRESRDGARQAVAPADWAFADCAQEPSPGRPDPTRLCLKGGFDPAFAYTLTYTGKDPKVLGVGFAATRDLVAFLRTAQHDDVGHPNPAGRVRWAVASGTSQSGNFLKSFVNLGFNADEQGRIVFDGVNPNIAARQVPLNLRFGVPGGAARPYEAGSEGTLWWSRYDDKARGRGVTSLLDRCSADHTCPKVVETFGSAEFWGLRMSPGLVGTDAARDVPLPPTVRRYYFPSVTHGGSFIGGFRAEGDPAPPGCRLVGNPNPSKESLRVAQAMLVAWVRDGKAPPPSRYPTLQAGDLVAPSAKAMGWPALPGAPTPDGKLNPLPDQDFGPSFQARDLSGVASLQPPRIRGVIPQRVPRVDADGNETAGVASVQLQVPLGTYLGWNVMAAGFEAGQGCGFAGGFIPFARTKADRLSARDPRPSLEERYGDHAGFVARVRAAVKRQADAGWLLPEDAARLVEEAEQSGVLR